MIEKDFLIEWVTSNSNQFSKMSDQIWGYAEPALREYKSSRLLVSYLEENGFTVKMGISGMPTAFEATWGEGKPVLGFFAEYDATPGESQKPVPYREAFVPHAAGFSDLHNGLGVASVAAIVSTKNAMEKYGMKGTLKIFGTPGEKLCISKCYNARDGMYDDLDALVGWHPWGQNTVTLDDGPGCYQAAVFEFYGTPTYGGRPWIGISALDASTIMNVNVNFMREHLPPYENITINEIITAGGQCPTSIPEFVQVWYITRAKTINGINLVNDILERCAKGAAMVTGADHKIRIVSVIRPWLPNHVMSDVALKNLTYVGAPKFTESEKAFVREIQKNVGLEPMDEPMDETVSDPRGNPPQFSGGADDITEFSWHTPTCRIHTAFFYRTEALGGYGFSTPTWSTAALAKTGIAHKALLTAAKAMGCTALELLLDKKIIGEAQAEFKKRTSENYMPVLIPDDAKPPVELTFPPYYPEGWVPPTDLDK